MFILVSPLFFLPHLFQASCYCMCLTALHLAEPEYAWVVVPVELGEILDKVGAFYHSIMYIRYS